MFAHRRPVNVPPQVSVGVTAPTGWFAGGPAAPQDPGRGVVAELQRALTDDPGIRLGGTTGYASRVYTGTGFAPQRWVAPGVPNSAAAMESAIVKAGTARKAVPHNRGIPGG